MSCKVNATLRRCAAVTALTTSLYEWLNEIAESNVGHIALSGIFVAAVILCALLHPLHDQVNLLLWQRRFLVRHTVFRVVFC